MRSLVVVVLICLIGSACCGGQSLIEDNAIDSGFKTTLTQRGVNHIRDIVVSEIRSKMSKIKLPDEKGKEHHIKYKVSHIELKDLHFGKVSLKRESSGFRLTINDIKFKLKCKWHMKYHIVSDHGHADIHVSKTKIGISLQVKAGSDGKPAAKAHKPDIHIGHLSVKFHGGMSKFYNLFKGTVAKKLKKTAEHSVKGGNVQNFK
ncbi:hypothetical protein GEMRC1_006472 [Eukaryota sp. GEM-RC1]